MSAIFAFVRPYPHRPLLASGRFANGQSDLEPPELLEQSARAITGVKPLRVRAA